MSDFRITALPVEPFMPLFAMSDAQLEARGMKRVVADSTPGFPCRVSLADAEPGETLLLLTHTHHDVPGPYRAAGPIYVRANARRATPAVNEVPDYVRQRLLSFRGYGADGWLHEADVADGREFEAAVAKLFANPDVAYLHVHNARPGCYSCRVERA